MPTDEVNRRAILKVSLGLIGMLGLGAMVKYLGYQSAPVNPTLFTLKAPQDYPAGSAISLPAARAWLFRDDKGLYAISAVCTHLGCVVTYANQGFECPCHGSRYNAAGYVLMGPAKLPLKYLKLALSQDGLVILDTKISVPPNQRLAAGS